MRKVMLCGLLLVSAMAVADNGALDTGFGPGGFALVDFDLGGLQTDQAHAMAVQADGRIVIAGSADLVDTRLALSRGFDTTPRTFAIARLHSDGGLDTSFGTNGRQTVSFDLGGVSDEGRAVAIDAQGRILVAGTAQVSEGEPAFHWGVARLTSNGLLDPDFGNGGRADLAVDAESEGALTLLQDMRVQPDGKIVLAGAVLVDLGFDEVILAAVARLNTDGSLDTGFADQGVLRFSAAPGQAPETLATALALSPDGGILVAGMVTVDDESDLNTDMFVARLLSDGSPDDDFGVDGIRRVGLDLGGDNEDVALDMLLDDSGRIVLAGSARVAVGSNRDMAAVRLLADGSMDSTFGAAGQTVVAFDLGESLGDEAIAVAIDDDGRIYLAGRVDRSVGPEAGIVRLTPDGLPDPAFGNAGRVHYGLDDLTNTVATAIAITEQGQAVIAGSTKVDDPFNLDMLVMRLAGDRIFRDGFEAGSSR